MLFLTTIALAAGRATASSTLTDPEDKKVKHTAAKAVDGLFKSGWGEGEDGYGEEGRSGEEANRKEGCSCEKDRSQEVLTIEEITA